MAYFSLGRLNCLPLVFLITSLVVLGGDYCLKSDVRSGTEDMRKDNTKERCGSEDRTEIDM